MLATTLDAFYLWDLSGRLRGFIDPTPMRSYPNEDEGISASFSPDGSLVALLSAKRTLICSATHLDSPAQRLYGPERDLEVQAVLGDRGPTQPGRDADAKFSAPRLRLSADGTVEAVLVDEATSATIKLAALTRADLPTAVSPAGDRLVALDGNAVRFWETTKGRETATIPLPALASRLMFTPDGTRLIVSLANGEALVWDTRPASDRQADRDQRAAERGPAEAYVDSLLAGTEPTGKLASMIREDNTASALSRVVRLEVLRERLEAIEPEAQKLYDLIK